MKKPIPVVKCRLDRLKISAGGGQSKPPCLEGFRCLGDFIPRNRHEAATYGRLRKMASLSDDCRINVLYEPRMPWLQRWHFTVIADDRTGITRDQVDTILRCCLHHRFSMVELTFDFRSGINRRFVLKHALFGKSRRNRKFERNGLLKFGARKSTKLVRIYWKEAIQSFRIELECHAALLQRMGVRHVWEFRSLYGLLPTHFRLVAISWKRLQRRLHRKFGPVAGQKLLEQTQNKAERSLRLALRFLKENGIANSHTFLKPLHANRQIKTALRRWLDEFWRSEDDEFLINP